MNHLESIKSLTREALASGISTINTFEKMNNCDTKSSKWAILATSLGFPVTRQICRALRTRWCEVEQLERKQMDQTEKEIYGKILQTIRDMKNFSKLKSEQRWRTVARAIYGEEYINEHCDYLKKMWEIGNEMDRSSNSSGLVPDNVSKNASRVSSGEAAPVAMETISHTDFSNASRLPSGEAVHAVTQPVSNLLAHARDLSNVHEVELNDSNMMDSDVPAANLGLNQEELELANSLYKDFMKSVSSYALHPCQLCDLLCYKEQIKSITLTERFCKKVASLTGVVLPVGFQKQACSRCRENCRKCKISPKCVYNNMELNDVPQEILCLSDLEVRLICQVNLFMKVYNLQHGKGQKAMKGLVIHFPQKVTEVTQHLPQNLEESEIVIVNHTIEGLSKEEEFEIRPQVIYKALEWLKVNNPLYRNIEIQEAVFNNLNSITIVKSQEPHDLELTEIICEEKFKRISISASTLKASFHQGNDRFCVTNRGMQCCAMSASFIANSFLNSPGTWNRAILDAVLVRGDELYTNIIESIGEARYLEAADVEGTLDRIFGEFAINLQMIIPNEPQQFQGFTSKAIPFFEAANTVEQIIQSFIDSEYSMGLVHTGDYTTAIYKEDYYVYYFDSHSRGLKGKSAPSKGTAITMKIEAEEAANTIAKLINWTCQPQGLRVSKSKPNGFSAPIERHSKNHETFTKYVCTLTPFAGGIVSDDVAIELSPSNSIHQMETDPEFRTSASDSNDNIEDEIIPEPEIPQRKEDGRFKNNLDASISNNPMSDCAILPQDFIVPELKKCVNICRTKGKPISTYLEQNLDLLAFPHLFPYGKNGLNQDRPIPISHIDYFQARLMSSDRRFSGNTDYLFYALSETDKNRVEKKISICAKQRLEMDPNSDVPPVTNLHSYMSSIRGSSSYWKQYCRDVFAMVRQLGVPTFFITFSFDDLNSLDCVTALNKAANGKDSEIEDPTTIPYEKRRELLNKYPIIAARHFARRKQKFLNLIKKKSEAIFGKKLLDYTFRVEFQARGSPHAHGLIWLDDVPEWSTPEGLRFLERNVKCDLGGPNHRLVRNYQMHRHGKVCLNSRTKIGDCRFSFPKPISSTTRILNEDESRMHRGKFFVLKRNKREEFVNNYHPILLRVLRCNMDIQPVTDANSVVYYIAKYMSKQETAETGKETNEAITSIQNSDLPFHQKAFKIAMNIMRNREISAQEAAYRLCHLPLHQSSRATVFLPAYLPENRIRMVKKSSLGSHVTEFCSNIIERYMDRPDDLENLCLLEFAAYYKPVTKEFDDDREIDVNVEDLEDSANIRLPEINLKTLGKMKRRQFPAVIQYPKFDPIDEDHKYFYSLILLYMPFRTENFCHNITPREAFQALKPLFRTHEDDDLIKIELAQELDRALLRISEFVRTEQSLIDLPTILLDDLETDYINEMFNDDIPPQEEVFNTVPLNAVQQIEEMKSKLDSDQQSVFNTVRDYCTRKTTDQLLMIVSGDGGCGKSYLVGLLDLYIQTIYENPNAVVLSAPTGLAALTI